MKAFETRLMMICCGVALAACPNVSGDGGNTTADSGTTANGGADATANGGADATANGGADATANGGADATTGGGVDATTLPPEMSCVGNCGGMASGGCFCDSECPMADCCDDWEAVCGGGGGMTDPNMSFFVTSRTVEVNGAPASGGNLGGLAGADAFCQTLAAEALPGDTKTWRAYLSTDAADARDRIGSGPWVNAAGTQIAANVDALHTTPPARNLLLTERGDDPLANGGRHDVITGSNTEGRKFADLAALMELFTFPDGSFTYPNATFDYSCAGWTNDGIADAQNNLGSIVNYAVVGHLDWDGLTGRSARWSASHVTACDQASMQADGGDIRIYCFAAN